MTSIFLDARHSYTVSRCKSIVNLVNVKSQIALLEMFDWLSQLWLTSGTR